MEAPRRELEPFTLAGPAGSIDGRLELPDPRRFARPRFLAVFGHPHPQHGGTMQSSVVVHGARALARLGGATARFDYRGVGRSEGSFGGGEGELEDYLAVAALLRARFPGVPALLAAGFSFGALRALECAARGAAELYLGVAPPLARAEAEAAATPRLERPAALVLAGADEIVPPPSERLLAERFADLRAVEIVPGAGHLFLRQIAELAAAVERAAERLLEPA